MIRRSTVHLFALCGGLVVANLYYNQPLLSMIGATFGVRARIAGLIPALTQAGYATGLFLLVPLADFIEPRRLLTALTAIAGVALIAGGAAPTISTLLVASFAIGVFSVVPQIVLPIAASLVEASQRGRTIGTIMAGLLTGVLLSRTVSGFVGHWLGWRAMYFIGAGLMLVTLLLIRVSVPTLPRVERISYRDVLASLLQLARTQPVLRETSFIGALAFGAFSAFWSTLAFFLTAPPWHLSSDAIGMFGVVGVAGVTAAPLVGRLSDRRDPRITAAVGLVIMLLAFGAFAGAPASLAGLVAGVILLDLGVQSALVSNQARFYAISAEAAGRLNTVFMTSYFLGGAAGSIIAAQAWAHARWNGVCAVGAAMLVLAFLPYLISAFRGRSSPRLSSP